jgi:RimJ/RimL family protein N-acetyltransferase
MFIITERLFLRPVWQEDAADIHLLINDWDIASKLARVPWPYALSDAQDFTVYAERAADAGREISLAICLRPSNQIIGLIGCQKHQTGEWELGYWLGKSFWGHGFAAEAAQAVVAGMFESRREPVLVSGYHLDNTASGRVLAKLGFTPIYVEDAYCRAQNRDVPVQRVKLTRLHWLDHSPISPIKLNHLSDQSDRERMVYNKKIDPSYLDTAPQNCADLIEEGSRSAPTNLRAGCMICTYRCTGVDHDRSQHC